MLNVEREGSQAPKKLRILLLSPRGPLYRHRTGIWKKSLRYAPLTLTTLASLIPEDLNAEVTLVDEGISDIDTNIETDLVGISVITGTAPRAYELAAAFRRCGVPVALGGVHPTLMPNEAMRHAEITLETQLCYGYYITSGSVREPSFTFC